MGIDLKDEVALVTGSARGLGRAMAQRLAELGAAVAIHDINPQACAEFGDHQGDRPPVDDTLLDRKPLQPIGAQSGCVLSLLAIKRFAGGKAIANLERSAGAGRV